jgi:predicted permease
MSRWNSPPKQWRVTISDLMGTMTGLSGLLGLYLARSAIPWDELYLLVVCDLLTVFVLGGTGGALAWRLWRGTHARFFDGFCGGGCLLLVLIWIVSPFLIILLGGF